MGNKRKKKSGKRKIGVLLLVLMIAVVGVVCAYGFEKTELESEMRQIKDEVEMQKYNAKMAVEQIKEQETETVEDDKIIVCLDPGHGGKDPGSMAGDRMEKDENLRLALKVKKNLEKRGVEVLLTREDDSYPTLEERAAYANSQKADLFVSLHRNYLAGYPGVNGIDVYINFEGTESDYAIGNAMCEQLSSVEGMKVNDLKLGSATDAAENYTVVAQTNMTACLVEMGYMSNYMDNVYFDDCFKSYSIAIAEAIWQFLQNDSSSVAKTQN